MNTTEVCTADQRRDVTQGTSDPKLVVRINGNTLQRATVMIVDPVAVAEESSRMTLADFVRVEFGESSSQAKSLNLWRASPPPDPRTRHLIDCLWLEARVRKECWREITAPFLRLDAGSWRELHHALVDEIFPKQTQHGLHGPPAGFHAPISSVQLGLVDHNLSILKRIYPAGDAGGGSDAIRYLRKNQHNPHVRIRWKQKPDPLTRNVLFFVFNEDDPRASPFPPPSSHCVDDVRLLLDRLALFPEWDSPPSLPKPIVFFTIASDTPPTIPTVLEGFSGKVGRFRPSAPSDSFGRTFPLKGLSPLPEVVHSSQMFGNFSMLIQGVPQIHDLKS